MNFAGSGTPAQRSVRVRPSALMLCDALLQSVPMHRVTFVPSGNTVLQSVTLSRQSEYSLRFGGAISFMRKPWVNAPFCELTEIFCKPLVAGFSRSRNLAGPNSRLATLLFPGSVQLVQFEHPVVLCRPAFR
jgi:hypothetical protein